MKWLTTVLLFLSIWALSSWHVTKRDLKTNNDKDELDMISFIHTPTNNLENSLNFYKKLNFEVISDENPTVVTDGKAIIEINPDRYARAGVKLYKDSWSVEVAELNKLTAVLNSDNGYVLSDPSGVWIYLVEGPPPVDFERKETSTGLTGNFMGLSLETIDMSKSAAIWSAAGFKKTQGSTESGWVLYMSDDGFAVSLLKPLSCPHLFFNPSMTYFNGEKNLEIIDNIRKAGVPITEEITHFNKEGIVDNIIIRDPGGYGFFIFND